VQDKPDEEATGKANITIDGSLVKIDRSKVDWSDDEFEEEEEEEAQGSSSTSATSASTSSTTSTTATSRVATPEKSKK